MGNQKQACGGVAEKRKADGDVDGATMAKKVRTSGSARGAKLAKGTKRGRGEEEEDGEEREAKRGRMVSSFTTCRVNGLD